MSGAVQRSGADHRLALADISAIVAQLRTLRDESLAARRWQEFPQRVPSRRALAGVVEGLSAALFPNRLGSRQLARRNVDYFVGHMLDTSLRELAEQVLRELQFAGPAELRLAEQQGRAGQIVGWFAGRLPAVRSLLDSDIQAAYEGDPAAHSIDEVLACSPGIQALVHHRLAHELYGLGAPLVARVTAEIAHSLTGIDIHPAARIGHSCFIDHGTRLVIGETAILGDRVRLYHGVTLGARRSSVAREQGSAKSRPRHPIIEDEVTIYANATILGRVTIGRGSVIGGNVWLTHDLPAGSRLTQAAPLSEEHDCGSGI